MMMIGNQTVEAFQAQHFNHLGAPLAVDGILGPQTRWAVHLATQHPVRIRIVMKALGSIGVREHPMGSNRGPEVDEWLRRCGIPIFAPGVPAPQHAWCAAAVSWWVSVEGSPRCSLARVYDLVQRYEKVSFADVKPGDMGYFLRPNRTGHIWLVTGRGPDVTMNVEGNTQNAVRVTTRPKADYLRVIDEPVTPGIVPQVLPAGQATR